MKTSLLALLLLGCTSNEYREGLLKLKWTPPPGVKLESEATEGAVTVAQFTGGVEVRSVAAAPMPASGDLDALRAAVITGSKVDPRGEVRSGRTDNIASGTVAHWELASAADRTQLYYVPGASRYVVISLVAKGSDFDRRSDKLQVSLSSLQLQ